MKILFDSKSSQVEVQIETHARLTELYAAITARGWTFERTNVSGAPLTLAQLNQFNVLCILTRLHQTAPDTTNPFPDGTNFQFDPTEVSAIEQFVHQGGGLLLISNHGPFPDKPRDDQTVNDKTLAAAFGFTIAPATFQSSSGPLVMSGASLSPDPRVAPILSGVTSIEVHNCCSITPAVGTVILAAPIAFLPSGVTNVSPINHESPSGKAYAWALNHGAGRVIIAGNSGLAGDTGSPFPAAGLIDAASNKQFLLNCLAWIAPRVIVPPPLTPL